MVAAESQETIRVTSTPQDAGFVVPYVLVMVGILSIITLFAMERLSRTINTIERIEAVSEARLAIHNATQEATYALTTASQSSTGFDLAGGVSGEAAEMGFQRNPADYVADIWSPDGAWRRTDDALIAIRDTVGLLPLNTAGEESVTALLRELGLPNDLAARLPHRLKDYVDADDRRRSLGGEAIDYRRTERPEPSNAPIRSIVELGNVMDWDTELDALTRTRLSDYVTLSGTQTYLSQRYAHPVLTRILRLSEDRPIRIGEDEFVGATRLQGSPSNRVRLTIVVGGRFPRVQQIEIEKTITHVERPFRIYFISEFAISPSAYESLRRDAGGTESGLGQRGNGELIKRVTPAASR